MSRLLTGATQVVLITAVLGAGLLSQSALAGTLVGDTAEAAPLQVTAEVPELWPGRVTTMDVRVTSSSADALEITALQARVGDAAPGCLAGNVVVVDYVRAPGEASYVVAPGGTVTVPLAITMVDAETDQDACKGVSFPIDLGVDAV